MKKNYFFITTALIAIVSVCVCNNRYESASLFEANIEALADSENKPPQLNCVMGGPTCEVIVMTADGICVTLEVEGMNKPGAK